MASGTSANGGRRRGRFGSKRATTDGGGTGAGGAGPAATVEDITYCYRLFLGREPEPHGFRGYQALVDEGHISRDELVRYFLASPEFSERLRKTFEWGVGAPVAVKVGALTYYVDPNDAAIGGHLREQGFYEPEVTEVVRRSLRAGDRFVDIGAAFGYFATLAGSIVGPTGQIIAVEPGPQNQSVLLLNLAANGVGAPEVHQLALDTEVGFVTYSNSGANGFISPFGDDPSELATRSLVRTSTLDAVVGDRTVDMIKIDVEGAEGRVLKGGGHVLRRDHPMIVMEFSPPSLESTSQMTGQALLEYLSGLGYSVDVIGGAERVPRSIDDVLAVFEATPADHIDLVLWAD
jgi:FkbM family methyltransferase